MKQVRKDVQTGIKVTVEVRAEIEQQNIMRTQLLKRIMTDRKRKLIKRDKLRFSQILVCNKQLMFNFRFYLLSQFKRGI